MGLISQITRAIKRQLKKVFGFLQKEKKDSVPRSWGKKRKPGRPKKKEVVVRHKRRLPGLKTFHKLLAAFLMFGNFVFSQVMLAAGGGSAQYIFLFFLANTYCLGLLLWKYRNKEE